MHTRQLSTMTYVPPSPFQIAGNYIYITKFVHVCILFVEIPFWLKEYVDAPFGSELDTHIQVSIPLHLHYYNCLCIVASVFSR